MYTFAAIMLLYSQDCFADLHLSVLFFFLILSFISFIFPSFVYSNFVMFKASFHGIFSSFKFERFIYHMFLGFYFLLH